MLGGTKIKKYVVQQIHNNFEDKAMQSIAKDDFNKPYFFVYLENFRRRSVSNSADEKEYDIVIQYQKAEQTKLETIGEQLADIFYNTLQIEDREILVQEQSYEIDEKTLYFYFTISFQEQRAKGENNTELMRKFHASVDIEGE